MDIDELANSLGAFNFDKPEDAPPKLPAKKTRAASSSDNHERPIAPPRGSLSDSLLPRSRKAKVYKSISTPGSDLK